MNLIELLPEELQLILAMSVPVLIIISLWIGININRWKQ